MIISNLKIFFIPLLVICLQISLYSQNAVVVSGTIRSPQGAIQAAQVEFLSLTNDFLSSGISGSNGRFRSEGRIAIGRKIKIKIFATGYKTLNKELTINGTGDAGEFMLERQNLVITGFVKDSITEVALPAVEIFFYDDQGKLIQAKSTNNMGYYDLETNFTYGQKITIRAFKKDYHDKEQSLTFTMEGRNNVQDIMLPEIGARGLRAFIRVKNKRNNKPLGGANVHFLDRKKSKYIDSIVPSKGELELKLYQRPGTTLDMTISRPNYHNIKANPTLSEDPQVNQFTYSMEKEGRSSLGAILLIGSGASALVSGGMFLSSTKQYDSYKDFNNSNRESDLKGAESKRTISAITGGVAAAALIGYIITRVHERNQERSLERDRTRTSLIPFSPSKQSYGTGIPIIGLAYRY